MRDWHSAWSWLKEMVAADSVAGNTFTGMLTRLTLRKPFHVARAAIRELYRQTGFWRSRVAGKDGSRCLGAGRVSRGCLGARSVIYIGKFNRTNNLSGVLRPYPSRPANRGPGPPPRC